MERRWAARRNISETPLTNKKHTHKKKNPFSLFSQSGRGHKGHKARSGAKTPTLFEGGQATLALRVRKYGFTNKTFKKRYEQLSLDRIQLFIDTGRLANEGKITMKHLVDAGVVRRIRNGLKLLAPASGTFAAKIDIEVTAVSKQAREAIEAAGGKVTTVYFNDLGLRTHLRYEPEEVPIRFARAPPDMWSRFDVPKYPSPRDAHFEKLAELEKYMGLTRISVAEKRAIAKEERLSGTKD